MPVRLLKPGIRTSEKFNRCSWIAQSAYVRLITLADDFGRYLANPRLLRSELFPLGGPRGADIPLPEVESAIFELQSVKLIVLYENDGKTFAQITNWKERTRALSSLYPPADDSHVTVISRSDDGHLTVTSPSELNSSETVENAGGCAQMPVKCPSSDSHLPASPPTPTPTPTPTPVSARSRFEKPSLEMVKLQAAKIGLPDAEAQHFMDFYESKGWIVGRSPMKSWSAALNNWKRNYDEKRYANPKNSQRPAASVERPDRNIGTHNKADGRYAAHAKAVAMGGV